MLQLIAYLDNSATTKPFEEVIEVMADSMRHRYGNPSALHKMGIAAEQEIKSCKKTILRVFNNPDGEIIFTSGGTESNNLAILGAARWLSKRKKQIITSKTEHKSVLEAFKQLESEGFEVLYAPVDRNGVVDLEQLISLVTDDTALISLMYVNNETGVVQPIEEISKQIKKMKKPPLFHVDCVQAFGKIPIDLKKTSIDLLSGSGHKIHGPKGIGFLFIRKGVQIKPLVYGGGQQMDLRPGTENTYGIIGLEKATALIFNDFENKVKQLEEKRNRLRDGIMEAIPEAVLNTPKECPTAPHILHISFPGIRGEVLLHALETKGIYVSIGSACNSKVKKYSHVLEAMKLSMSLKEGAVRFSLSVNTTEEEVEYAISEVASQYKALYAIIKGR